MEQKQLTAQDLNDPYVVVWASKDGVSIWARNKVLIGVISFVMLLGIAGMGVAPIILGTFLAGMFR